MADTSPEKGNAKLLSKDEAIDLLRDALEHYARLAPGTITARGALRMTAHLVPGVTPPSPSTAPEVDERAAFEAWVTRLAPGHPLARDPNGRYSADCNEWAWDGWKARAALVSRPAEMDDEGLPAARTAIPRASNDALIALAKYWKLDGDWMTCKGCRRSLIASRDGEELNHGEGCKFWDQQHPWAQLRELIARRPAPAESAL